MSESLPATVVRPSRLLLAVLVLLVIVCPLPTYLLALALFGLPHVLWEWAWVRQTLWPHVPRRGRHALAGALALQAAGRIGSWQGWLEAPQAMLFDLGSLALLMLLVSCWPLPGQQQEQRQGLVRGIAGLAAILLVGVPLLAGTYGSMLVLLLLAVAHNFTPLGLAPLAGDQRLLHHWRGMFWLPLLVACSPIAPFWAGEGFAPVQVSDAQGLVALGLPFWPGLVSSVVLAQCLHYYAVLRWLPASLGAGWSSQRWQKAALGASAALLFYFSLNFVEARRLYAVFSGAHAWLEWPLLLAGLSGWARPQTS